MIIATFLGDRLQAVDSNIAQSDTSMLHTIDSGLENGHGYAVLCQPKLCSSQ